MISAGARGTGASSSPGLDGGMPGRGTEMRNLGVLGGGPDGVPGWMLLSSGVPGGGPDGVPGWMRLNSGVPGGGPDGDLGWKSAILFVQL